LVEKKTRQKRTDGQNLFTTKNATWSRNKHARTAATNLSSIGEIFAKNETGWRDAVRVVTTVGFTVLHGRISNLRTLNYYRQTETVRDGRARKHPLRLFEEKQHLRNYATRGNCARLTWSYTRKILPKRLIDDVLWLWRGLPSFCRKGILLECFRWATCYSKAEGKDFPLSRKPVPKNSEKNATVSRQRWCNSKLYWKNCTFAAATFMSIDFDQIKSFATQFQQLKYVVLCLTLRAPRGIFKQLEISPTLQEKPFPWRY